MPLAPEYFTGAEFRALPDMGESKYDDDRVSAVAEYVVAVIERVVGTSFVGRAQSVTRIVGSVSALVLPHAHVVSLTEVTCDGVAQDLAAMVFDGGVVRFRDGRCFGGTVVVSYLSGYSATPPADIKEAALQATRARLIETASNALLNDRRQSMSMAEGGSVTFVQPGGDRPFGFPSVDAVIIGWRDRLNVFGFA